jgi:hypothetical protein
MANDTQLRKMMTKTKPVTDHGIGFDVTIRKTGKQGS